MSTVSLIPLGVGEAFTARYYTSCLVLGIGDKWLLIDCPHPVRKMLHEASIAAGLPKPLDFDRNPRSCAQPSCMLIIAVDWRISATIHSSLGSPGEALDASRCFGAALGRIASRWNGTRPGKDGEPPSRKTLSDYFELIDLDLSGPVKCGPFPIECRRTIHSVPTYAFRVTAGGRVFGYSADTAYDPA